MSSRDDQNSRPAPSKLPQNAPCIWLTDTAFCKFPGCRDGAPVPLVTISIRRAVVIGQRNLLDEMAMAKKVEEGEDDST